MSIFCDFRRNKGNIKFQFILILFRIASLAKISRINFLFLIPFQIFYRFFVEWLLGVELPYKTEVGPGLIIYHGHALVINDSSIIGVNCVLRHSTTIGNKELSDGSYSRGPVIGNNVDIGSNVVILGPITIGDNVIIGAGSVVVKDVPSNSVVVGNPGRVIRNLL